MSFKTLNLDAMSYRDLASLSRDLDAAMTRAKAREVADVRSQVSALVERHGFKLTDLVGAPRRKSQPSTPKFINPRNPSQTWSGRGRRPKWFVPEAPSTAPHYRSV